MRAGTARLARLVRLGRESDLARVVLSNCSARVLAIVGLAAATILVARTGGPSDVGVYALLRMLPGLVGVVCAAGLPGAMGYFLSEPRRRTPGLWPALFAILVGGAVLGMLVWFVASPLLATTFFPGDSTTTITWGAVAVGSQLVLTVGKTSLQGLQDRRGGDIVIAAEELAFLPCYGLALLVGVHGTPALLLALVLADLTVAVDAWRRVGGHLQWRPIWTSWKGSRPTTRSSRDLVVQVLTYGMRGQLGGMMTLLNLRLDFAILGAIAGPGVLGGYAIASKYAELLRLPGTALTWVCYPMLAELSPSDAAHRARRLVAPTILANVAGVAPFLLLAGPVIGLLYGDRFDAAVAPAQLLVLGMLLGGAAGVSSGYLYGRGRPGLNSWALGLGLVLTVVLDLILIPTYGVMGAAAASTTTYLLTDAALLWLLYRTSRVALTQTAERASAVGVSS